MELFTIPELIKSGQVSETATVLKRWCARNNIVKKGNSYILSRDDVQNFKARNKKVGRPKAE